VDPEVPVGDTVEGVPARPPERRALQGSYVLLRPVDPNADAPALWQGSHDGGGEAASVWTYMPYGPFAGVDAMRGWLEIVGRSDDPLFLTVASHERGPVGMAAFMNADSEHRRIELGHIWFASSAQRTEANTEAAFLMLREAFEGLGYRRVEWKCDALNERSRVAALRLGFAFEGVFRQHMVVKGRNRDTAWFSMIDEEWPARRRAFERWLSADPEDRASLAAMRGEPA
jgi:RimJ/RimL family protein N-acetyltransferase